MCKPFPIDNISHLEFCIKALKNLNCHIKFENVKKKKKQKRFSFRTRPISTQSKKVPKMSCDSPFKVCFVFCWQVQMHSPAGRAGLQPRDLLVSVAGQIVFDMKHDEVASLVCTGYLPTLCRGLCRHYNTLCFILLYYFICQNDSKQIA